MVWLLLCIALAIDGSPVSEPHLPDGDISKVIPSYFDSKKGKREYHLTKPQAYEGDHPLGTKEISHIDKDAACGIPMQMAWSSQVGSAIYSSPVIFPSGPDGHRQIFVNTFYDQIEILGYDGYKPWGWPMAFEGSSFMGSPMLFDIDNDGKNDVGVVDKNGNMFFIRIGEFGQYLEDYHVQIPKLKVKRDWFKGLNDSFVDNNVMLSMFDHAGTPKGMDSSKVNIDEGSTRPKPAKHDELSGIKPKLIKRGRIVEKPPEINSEPIKIKKGSLTGRRLSEANSDTDTERGMGRRLQGSEGEQGEELQDPGIPDFGEGGPGDMDFRYGEADDYVPRGDAADMDHPAYYGKYKYMYGGLQGDDLYPYYMDNFNNSDYLMVDAHVLSSPTLADVNGDGHLEVVMGVSYYFDKSEYAGKDIDFDPSNFVAGGVVCWDLQSQMWSWTVHLDLTTDKSHFKAYIYGAPTVADLDGDGRSEVIVGTSLGLLYVLDGESGYTKRHFPMQFNQIEAQVAVSDLVGDGHLEMIVADMGGNLVVLSAEGDVVWDRHLSGTLPHTPSVGDVDGDGQLDVVVVSVTEHGCHLWALRGDTGETLPSYPIALPYKGTVTAPVLLVDLHDYSNVHRQVIASDPALPPWIKHAKDHDATPLIINGTYTPKGKSIPQGLHLIMPTYDGHLYIVDGVAGCADRIDIGEHVYSMPLVDDVTGDGKLDIVVGTMNGQMLVVGTEVPYHAMNAWPSFPKHRYNGFTHGQLGISVPESARGALRHADIKGNQNLSVTFDIWDDRKNVQNRRYTVIFTKYVLKLHPSHMYEFIDQC